MNTKVKKNKSKISSIPEKPGSPIYLPDVDAEIAKRAYYKAESRGFAPGYELDDWLEAEQDNNAA